MTDEANTSITQAPGTFVLMVVLIDVAESSALLAALSGPCWATLYADIAPPALDWTFPAQVTTTEAVPVGGATMYHMLAQTYGEAVPALTVAN